MELFYDLHIHSCLSPCGNDDCTPDNIAMLAQMLGLQAVALTDHNTCKNCPAFFKAAEQAGILPIAGMELTVQEEFHVLCLFPQLDQAMKFDELVHQQLLPFKNDKSIYGNQDYDYLLNMIAKKGADTGSTIEVFQSNHEGAIIDRIQDAYFDGTEGIVINPGAYTHYSYAIRDALASLTGIPKIEVHISDVNSREEFRHISVTEPVCDGQIVGQGLKGYIMAIDILNKK